MSGYAYEVQYLLTDTDDGAVATLREVLGGLGDSLAVVGGEGLFNVHVHVDDIGAAVEAGVQAGRPFRIGVTRFADQVGPECAVVPRAVVAVCSGAGLAQVLRDAGVVVVEGEPAPGELLAAVRATGAVEVVLLPGGAAVEDALAGSGVAVVPTSSAVQVLAAVSVADPARALADDVAAMTAAAAATRTASVTYAVRGATTAAGIVLPGDALGVVDGAVAVVGAEPAWVAVRLLEQVAAGAELVTAVLGEDAPAGLAERLRAAAPPGVELVVLDGGQAAPLLLLGVE